MTKVFISFDTEDYINPHGVDGIVRSAEILEKHGAVGCYNLVARFALALKKWGREDAIETLKRHETELHTMGHSMHPTINEYTDIEDFEEAKRRLLDEEQKACDIIKEILGEREFYAACPPGNSFSYVAHYGYAEMGISIYDGDVIADAVRNRPVHACNIACIAYNHSLDNYLVTSTTEQIDRDLDRIAKENDYYVFYHHPQKAFIDEFCDLVNRITPDNEKEWKLSGYRPKEETEKFYENFDYLVGKLMSDPRFELVTYADLARELNVENRVITKSDLPEIKSRLDEYFFPLTVPDSYCITDILYACRDLLLGEDKHVCGKVYGFLDTPYSINEELTVSADEIRESATQIKDYFLPTEITVGGKRLGTRDWLNAALSALCGETAITVKPSKWQIDMDQFPDVRDLKLKGTWVYDDTFEDKYISERLRLQSWTYRMPKGGPRKVFYDK